MTSASGAAPSTAGGTSTTPPRPLNAADPPAAGGALHEVQARVDNTTAVMQDNVQVMVENLDKANVLEDKSANLASQAREFQNAARATKYSFWCRLCQQRLCVGGVIGTLLLIVIIVVAASLSGGAGGGGSADEGGSMSGSGGGNTPGNGGAGTNTSTMFLYYEDFADAPVLPSATYRDVLGHTCAHKLLPVHERRTVQDASRMEFGDLGFESFYADTLGADGSAALHADGADLGVTNVGLPGGTLPAYALRASGIDGFVSVCTNPVWLLHESVRAEATIYLAQAGWHEPTDELRVWADLGGARQISLLPGCAPKVTASNVDVLGLRNSSTPGIQYAGPPNEGTDPSLLPDSWQWRTLGTELGQVDTPIARVCVGLQSGAGSEAVYIASFRFRHGTDLPAPECAPSAVLQSVADEASLKALAVSCVDNTGRIGAGRAALIAIAVITGLGSLALLAWSISKEPIAKGPATQGYVSSTAAEIVLPRPLT